MNYGWVCRIGLSVLSLGFVGCLVPSPELPRAAEESAFQMAAAGKAFVAALSTDQAALAQFPLDADEARTSWSNLPSMFVERRGIRLGDLSDAQRRILHGLIRASTSHQGYQKLVGVIRLEDILHEEAKSAVERGETELPDELIESWQSVNYWVAIFGEPGEGDWGWQLSGHHLAANFTVVDDRLSFTPLFLGAEPHEIWTGVLAGWQVLSHEAERGLELIRSLDADQRARALLDGETPEDVITGPGRKGSLKTFAGLRGSEMDVSQQRLLWALIDEYVANVDGDAAAAQLARIRSDGLEKLYFAWLGPWDDDTGRYYYRVHGPSVLIEYVVQEGVGGKAGNHVHSIIRDPSNDYGEDWLNRHYEEHHKRIR